MRISRGASNTKTLLEKYEVNDEKFKMDNDMIPNNTIYKIYKDHYGKSYTIRKIWETNSVLINSIWKLVNETYAKFVPAATTNDATETMKSLFMSIEDEDARSLFKTLLNRANMIWVSNDKVNYTLKNNDSVMYLKDQYENTNELNADAQQVELNNMI